MSTPSLEPVAVLARLLAKRAHLQTQLATVNAGIRAARRVVNREAGRQLKKRIVDGKQTKDVGRVLKKGKTTPAAASASTVTPGRLEGQTRAFRDLQRGARGNGRVDMLLSLYRGSLSCPRCRRAARRAKGGPAHTHGEGCVLQGTARSRRGFASA